MARRYTLWDEMRRLQEQMDRMFESFFNYDAFDWPLRHAITGPSDKGLVESGSAISNYRPALADVWETDKEIVATVELPGVDKNDIQIDATEDGLDIKVEKKQETKKEDKGFYRIERNYAGFYRHIPLPDGVDVNKIKAGYKNGVLELRIPKSPSAKKGKRIKVE